MRFGEESLFKRGLMKKVYKKEVWWGMLIKKRFVEEGLTKKRFG